VNKGLGPLLRDDAWYGDGYVEDCEEDDYECEEFRALWYHGCVCLIREYSFAMIRSLLLILTSNKPTTPFRLTTSTSAR
jgi:hypothetical protein